MNKSSDVLGDIQKNNEIDYLLKKLKKAGVVRFNEDKFWALVF